MKLYLASKSPRRQELMTLITTEFTVADSNFDEKEIPVTAPETYVQRLAVGKALHADITDANAVVIGCDTVVVSPQGEIFGKPADEDEAFSMLKSLSGQTHSVVTGVCLLRNKICDTFAVTSFVTFHPLSDADIRGYLSCGEYKDKAGAYGIQGKGALLCKKIAGDYFNVVGLPVSETARHLAAFSLNIWTGKF